MTSIGVGVGVGLHNVLGEDDISNLPTMFGWWDASDTSTITTHPGLVSIFSDKSASGYDLLQNVGPNQPISGSNTINGLNVLRFDPLGNEYLISDPVSFPIFDGNDICVSVVCNPLDTNVRRIFHFKNLVFLENDGIEFQGGAGADNKGHPITTGPQILTMHITDDASTFYKNGELINTEPFAPESVDTIVEIEFSTQGATEWDGDMGEAILWRDPASIQRVINYQKQKWGIA